MGYYAGIGARRITTIAPSAKLPQTQPACLSDAATQLYDCGNWSVSASWNVPSTAGFGHLLRSTHSVGYRRREPVFFVVRNDASHSDVLFQTSDETWHAYNDYGGHSLYGTDEFDLPNRGFKVSYNRPSHTRSFESATFLFTAEYPMVRWLEANGYDVSYSTGVDAVRNGASSRTTRFTFRWAMMSTSPGRSGTTLRPHSGPESIWRFSVEMNSSGKRDGKTRLMDRTLHIARWSAIRRRLPAQSSTPPILLHGRGHGATHGLVLQRMADDLKMRSPEHCSWSMGRGQIILVSRSRCLRPMGKCGFGETHRLQVLQQARRATLPAERSAMSGMPTSITDSALPASSVCLPRLIRSQLIYFSTAAQRTVPVQLLIA